MKKDLFIRDDVVETPRTGRLETAPLLQTVEKALRESGRENFALTYAKQGKDIEITLRLTEGE